ncbi:MAG: leucyl/phenylalanyl-tRNA--protein transferase [Cellvibrio sp.]
MIPWIPNGACNFPPVDQALIDPDGLLAAGESISWQQLLTAYSNGIFPWYNEPDPVLWWSPNPRAVLFPDQFHLSSSLKKQLRKKQYLVTYDRCFKEVMKACAQPRNYTDSTWINDTIIDAYSQLHEKGLAHSVEVWDGDTLVGGLYGVALGRVFFGESMFSRSPNTSKIGFAHLVHQLKEWDYYVIDCQVESDHMMSLGAQLIPRREFQSILNAHLDHNFILALLQEKNDNKKLSNRVNWSSIKTSLPY